MYKRKIIWILLMTVGMLLLTGCSNKDVVKVYGGDLLKYSFCMEEGKKQVAVCPIITSKKVSDITFNNYITNDKDIIKISCESIDVEDFIEYEGFYVYFAILSIECVEYERTVDASVEKLLFMMDGELVEYNIPNWDVKNTYYYKENYNCELEENTIYISSDFTGIYGYVPDENLKANLIITSDKDIKVVSYNLQDYLKVLDLTVDSKQMNNASINTELKMGADISLEYAIELDEGITSDCIIRSSQIIIYEYNGQNYLWVYTPGVYIWQGYTDYSNIMNYIEAL